VEVARLLDVAFLHQPAHAGELAAQDMSHGGDAALPSQTEDEEGEGVLAGIDVEVTSASRNPWKIALAYWILPEASLMATTLSMAEEADHRLRLDVAAGARGDIINDYRQGGGFRHGLEMPEDTFLTGPVVVRADLQVPSTPSFFRLHGHLDGLGGAVGTGARDHRHPARGMFQHYLDDPQVLVVIQGG